MISQTGLQTAQRGRIEILNFWKTDRFSDGIYKRHQLRLKPRPDAEAEDLLGKFTASLT